MIADSVGAAIPSSARDAPQRAGAAPPADDPLGGLHPYAARVYEELRARAPHEKEFLQAVHEVLGSVSIVLRETPRYEAEGILERLVEPERVIQFRVPWVDDRGRVKVCRGFRVQHSSALGPYKGGTRFHAMVTLSSLKALAFEQTFKNALTGLGLGGGKGGADFQFRGRSEAEVARFCQSYMSELFRYIGPDTDVPAGDLGVGGRELGLLFGQYRRLVGNRPGAITGKGLGWGGSRLRPEATGYGVAYFAERMLGAQGDALAGKTVTISGFGNVAWGVVNRITQLGGKVVTLSGPDGFVHDPDGVRDEKIEYLLTLRTSLRDEVRPYSERFGVRFHPGSRPWGVPCDLAIPCAIEGELDESDAGALVDNGCRAVVEGANMPVTRAAVRRLRQAGVWFVPGKASNAGGVAVSGLEMTQNRSGRQWSAAEVDEALRGIMASIHDACLAAAKRFGSPGDYLLGANVAGFMAVAEAMSAQGLV